MAVHVEVFGNYKIALPIIYRAFQNKVQAAFCSLEHNGQTGAVVLLTRYVKERSCRFSVEEKFSLYKDL